MRDLVWGVGGTGAGAVRALHDRLAESPGGAAGEGPVLVMAPTRGAFEAAAARIAGSLQAAELEAPAGLGAPGELGAPAGLAGVDVVLATSGSTDGRGRLVGLSRAALDASARGTLARLGGPGQWVTSLPVHAVAGFQVVNRSVVAGLPPVVYAPESGFDAPLMRRCVARLEPVVRRYLSLVPTQLHRAVEAEPEVLAAFDAVLVGGAALGDDLARRAAAAGVRVVASYGATETAGGCVYDGVPLDGVEVRLVDGLVRVAGPTLATRYVDVGEQPFATDGGRRWLLTRDRGEWVGGRLVVRGRADDVIISGGVNVDPADVEDALARLGGEWVVVGVPDAEWGQRVVALGTVDADAEAVRAATAHLGPAGRPRATLQLDALPLRPTGKVDRRAAALVAAERLGLA